MLHLGRFSVELGSNDRVGLLKELSHIHFSRLRKLDVRKNRIESVEMLPCMPHIQELSICASLITQTETTSDS